MNQATSDLQGLLAAARALDAELQQLRLRFDTLGLAHGCEWVERELGGYPPKTAAPRYRNVPCEAWAELMDAAGTTERVPLPTAHLADGDRALVREGVGRLADIAAPEGFRPEAAAFIRAIDPRQHALYLRGMPPERAGQRIVKVWEAIPLAGLHAMLDAVRAYGRAMHDDAVRRRAASAPQTSRTR